MSSFGRYLNLSAQAEKLCRLNKDGNKSTVRRYYKGYKRFLRYLSETTKIQRISDITDKELSDYVLYMKNRWYSPSTIKTDLSSIRFWHSKISDAKFELQNSNKFDFTNGSIAENSTDNSDYVWWIQRYYYSKKLCQMLKIGKNAAYELIHSGQIKSIKIKRQIRISKQSVISYLENEIWFINKQMLQSNLYSSGPNMCHRKGDYYDRYSAY